MKDTLRLQFDRLGMRLQELDARLADPASTADMNKFRELSREQAEASEIVELYRRFTRREADRAAAQEMLAEGGDDAEMATMAREEIAACDADLAALDAALQAPPNLAPDADLRAWLRAVPDGPGLAAAAFDTRLGSRWSGGASSGIARRLRRHGYHLIAGPEGFVLDGLMGPLRDGELIRAHGWGAELRHQVLM